MNIERLTVRQLIALLQHYPDDLPVVVQSYEAGYDPITNVEILTIAETEHRAWYIGIYDKTDQPEESAVLISSKYNRAALDTPDKASE